MVRSHNEPQSLLVPYKFRLRLATKQPRKFAFKSAEDARQDGFHDRAEKMFADFIVKFPASPRVF